MKAGNIPETARTAATFYAAWSAMGPNARRPVLIKVADALEARKNGSVTAITSETETTAGWAMFNLGFASGMVCETAALIRKIGAEVIPSVQPGCIALALKEPVGVILCSAQWNAPIIPGVRAIAVPLACGTAVILKASEACPRTHSLIIEAFAEVGVPEGVVYVVCNAPEEAAEVVGAPIDSWWQDRHPARGRVSQDLPGHFPI